MPPITEMRCPGARRRGRLRALHCREFSMAIRPSVYRRQAPHLPQAARERLLRHSQSVERRQRALPAGARLQGARHDQLRPRPLEGLSRRRAVAGRRARALPRAGRGDRHSAQCRLRERLCRRSRRRGAERDALHRDRRRRTVDRGFAAARAAPALRLRRRRGAREGGARRDRQGRRRRGVHRAQRRLHPRPARPRRDHPPHQGVRRSRRRLHLFAGHQDPRADRGDGEGGGAQGDQLPQSSARSASR